MPRRCKQCKTPIENFAKSETAHEKRGCCSEQCAITFGMAAVRRKEQRKQSEARKAQAAERRAYNAAKRARKERLKTRSDWMKEAQAAFNAFIRERDRELACACCNSWGEGEDWQVGGKWDAGHFLSRGAYPELRFEELNCHKQLKSCNAGSSKYARKGRTVAESYRKNLINKIGLEKVEWLEGPHEEKKYTIDDLKQIIVTYKAKLKELKQAADHG